MATVTSNSSLVPSEAAPGAGSLRLGPSRRLSNLSDVVLTVGGFDDPYVPVTLYSW